MHAAPQVAWVWCSFLLRRMLSYCCWFIFGIVRNGESAKSAKSTPRLEERRQSVPTTEPRGWDDVGDSLLVSSVFLLQRMFSGFGFVGNRHNDRCGLDSPSNLPVPNHGATFVPSMPHFLETRFYVLTGKKHFFSRNHTIPNVQYSIGRNNALRKT